MTDDDRARGNNNLVLTESNWRTSPQKIRSGQGIPGFTLEVGRITTHQMVTRKSPINSMELKCQSGGKSC